MTREGASAPFFVGGVAVISVLNSPTTGSGMSEKPDRDIEKAYSASQFAAKLRRLADAVESDKPFNIQIANERIYVPRDAVFNVEHERVRLVPELIFVGIFSVPMNTSGFRFSGKSRDGLGGGPGCLS